MNFHVGQKVVCVDDGVLEPSESERVSKYIKCGETYVVRWIGPCPFEPWNIKHGITVRLDGIVRPNINPPEWSDFPFCAKRFRPLEERKTDIAIFLDMLSPVPIKDDILALLA